MPERELSIDEKLARVEELLSEVSSDFHPDQIEDPGLRRGYVVQALRKLEGEIEGRAQLTPFEALLFGLAGNALLKVAETCLGASSDRLAEFRQMSHLDRVRRLAMWAEADFRGMKSAVGEALFASQVTAARFEASGLPSLDAAEARFRTMRTAETAEEVLVQRRAIRPVLIRDMGDGRYGVAFSTTREGREHVNPSLQLEETVRREAASVLIDPMTSRIEYRGPSLEMRRVVAAAERFLSVGDDPVTTRPLNLSGASLVDVIDLLNGRANRTKYVNNAEDTKGVKSVQVDGDPRSRSSTRNVDDSEAVRQLRDNTDLELEAVSTDIKFTYKREEYSVRVSLATGRMVFRRGTTSSEVIDMVHRVIDQARESSESE